MREGELSVSEGCVSESSSRYDGSSDEEKGSNCTEERNFTPGQKQFKSFLRLTADRRAADYRANKSREEERIYPRSVTKVEKKLMSNALRSQLKLNLDKVSPPPDKN